MDAGKQKWDTIDLSISCGGGDLVPSFALYNELKGLKVTFVTRNSGAVDSAAIMPFLLGTKRYASASSAFFFHQTAWTFPSQANVPFSLVRDAAEWLGHYQKMMAQLVAVKSKLTAEDVHRMMVEGSTVTAQDAKKNGLIDDVVEFSMPPGARWWQV
jgi:ATP-dependent Clp protease protease subunit